MGKWLEAKDTIKQGDVLLYQNGRYEMALGFIGAKFDDRCDPQKLNFPVEIYRPRKDEEVA